MGYRGRRDSQVLLGLDLNCRLNLTSTGSACSGQVTMKSTQCCKLPTVFSHSICRKGDTPGLFKVCIKILAYQLPEELIVMSIKIMWKIDREVIDTCYDTITQFVRKDHYKTFCILRLGGKAFYSYFLCVQEIQKPKIKLWIFSLV